MALTRSQLLENVDSLEAQGASQEEVQEYINTVGPLVPETEELSVAEEPKRGIFGNLLEVGKGAGKGLVSSVAGASSLGEQVLSFGKKKKEQTLGGRIQESEFVQPQNLAQRIGFGAEQVAEFLIPSPAGKIRAAQGASRLARFGAGALKFGAVTGEATGRAAIQRGTTEELGKDFASQAALTGAFSAISKAAGFGGRLGAAVLGKTTGTSTGAVREAFENPAVKEFARKASKDGGAGLLREALNDAKTGFSKLVSERSSRYVSQLEKIKARPEKLMEIKENAVLAAQEALEDASVKLRKGKIATVDAFRDSAIEQGQNAVKKAYRTLADWSDNSAAGLDRLKKKLNQFKNSVRNTTDGSYAAIKKMTDSVDDGLKTFVPGYKKMTADYAAASDMLDEIERALSPNSPNADLAVTKLLSTLRENKEVRREFLRTLEKKAGRDVAGKIAGFELSPLAPKGLVGRLAATGAPLGAGAALMNPQAWPALIVYLAASSPRLVGEATSLIGSVYRAGTPLKTVQEGLRGLIQQAASGTPDGGEQGTDTLR